MSLDCRAIREDRPVDQEIERFQDVGGWFSIRALQKLLTPEEQVHFKRALKKAPASDVGRLPPRALALAVLPWIVPNSPIDTTHRSPMFERDDEALIWNEWIPAHRSDLSKLEPTGEGVDFSDRPCNPNGTVRTTR
jgi:hypothetical protein